ncbi:unnamed protein product [Gemmataceae bacterium]|nr:unnamed protein product [Gemmataceae bacterium]VTU02681.1 unnamed protein product [Gemmataceae bacterium]
MGVGIELLGKHVRCPHCKQVVLAPATPGGAAGGPAAAPPQPQAAPQPVPAAPPPPQLSPPVVPVLPPMPEPMFNIMPKEAADSILSEPDESDDEVFGSQGFNRMPVPRLPDLNPGPSPYGPAPGYGPPASPYGAPQPYSPPPPPPQPAPVHVPQPYVPAPAAAQNGDPFSFDPSGHSAPAPQPVVVPAPVHVPVPAAAQGPQGLQATALDVNPFGGFDGPPAPPQPPQHVRPAVVAAPLPAPVPAPAPSNPWAGVESQGAQPFQPAPAPQPYPAPAHQQYPSPAPQPYPAPAAAAPFPAPAPASSSQNPARQDEDRDAPKAQPRAQRGRAGAAPAAGGIPKPVVYGLAGYAVLATLLALYGLFFKGGEAPPEHPLSTIPDSFGEFDPAQRKKVSLYRFKVDGPLPPSQVASLDGTINVGGLEIQPVRVERRTLELFTDTKGQKVPSGRTDSTLVLHLKVKNNSDMAFCPLDPAFSRKPTAAADVPPTRLVVGTKEFAGGPIVWPSSKAGSRMYEREQEKDAEPLKPGETREYSVCAPVKLDLMNAIKKDGDRVVWRVQVRRTPVEYNGKSVPVTAIVGVEFSRADIQNF